MEKFKLLLGLILPERCFKDDLYRQIYKKGQERVQNDLNMFSILEQLVKIKASLAVILEEDHTKL